MADAMNSCPLSARPERAMHRCSGSIKQGACQDEDDYPPDGQVIFSLDCP